MSDAMKNGEESASPVPYCSGYGNAYPVEGPHGWETVRFEGGLTKREHFAAMAMQGMLADGWGAGDARSVADWRDHMAHEAVRHADALLRALRSSKEGAADDLR